MPTYRRMKAALLALEKRNQDQQTYEFFFTTIKEQLSHSLDPSLEYFDNSLNDSQKNAVQFGLSVRPVGLIHGISNK